MNNGAIMAKMALTGAFATLGAMWNKIGWMVLLWAVCMGLDYATGTLAALHTKTWDSIVAREGIWHKAGMLIVVLVAGLFDVSIKQIAASAGIVLPFDVLVLPIVLSWYIITELGSILENAVKMGADNVPGWLKQGLKIAGDAIDKAGESATGGKDDAKR